jgi:hypothetical protein
VHGSEPDVTEGSMLQGPARERSETYETHIRCAVETRLHALRRLAGSRKSKQ